MERLKTFYNNLHWKHTGWWAKLLLFVLAFLKFTPELILLGLVSALVSLSSTMYSVAGSMRAKFKLWIEVPDEDGDSMWLEATTGFLIFLLPLGLPSAIIALVAALLASVFTPFLSANQCDVVSRIFLKYGLHKLAYRVAVRGRESNPRGHTKAFLNLTCARTYGSSKHLLLGPLLAEANDIAFQLRHSSSLHQQGQAARVYNQMAEVFDWIGNEQRAESMRETARGINLKLGLGDQLLKHP